jgi:hypothetical protein
MPACFKSYRDLSKKKGTLQNEESHRLKKLQLEESLKKARRPDDNRMDSR